MKIKTFIFRTPYNIEGMNPIRKEANQYGVTENFYLVKNSNLETLLKNRFNKDFKNRNPEDVQWYLNSNNVAIVDTVSRLENFIKKDYFQLMKSSSNTNIILQ